MVPIIYGPQEHHRVRSVEEYRRAQAAFIAKQAQSGARVAVHDSPAPLVARIDANTWLIDCECGAGNATHPDWALACCFGCGAIHTAIVFPDPLLRGAIETVLLGRPRPFDRSWRPGETLETLVAENLAINAAVPAGLLYPEFQP